MAGVSDDVYNEALDWDARFQAFVTRKTATASDAVIPGYYTDESYGDALELPSVSNAWTMEKFDGPFFESRPTDPALPAVNTVFVQSADGNTGSPNPPDLGGGLTDKHLIYEGLSSVHANAILSGASTIRGEQMIMAIWHPQLVALRLRLGLDRYPLQVVATRSGDLEIDTALLFNLPEVQVVILTGDAGAEVLRPHLTSRSWIHVVSGGTEADVVGGLRRLKSHAGISRVSCIGGRTLTTQLIDAGVIQDIYLTTSPTPGGEPNTPFYTGLDPLRTTLVVKKSGRGPEAGVVFEHLQITSRRASIPPRR